MPRRADISHLAEANPLLLGAVGLGLGVAIGTLFPRGMGRTRPASKVRETNGSSATTKSASRRRPKKARAVKARPAPASAS